MARVVVPITQVTTLLASSKPYFTCIIYGLATREFYVTYAIRSQIRFADVKVASQSHEAIKTCRRPNAITFDYLPLSDLMD